MRLASPRAMLVPPSGSVTQADRQQFLRHYAGILWAVLSQSPFATAPYNSIGYMDPNASTGYMDPVRAISYMDPNTSIGGV